MRNNIVKSVIFVGLVAFGLNVYANDATRDPGVNKRQHHQKERIQQGVKSGELTKHEAKELRNEHRDIHQLEQTYKSDGTLTKTERKDLQQQLNQSSHDIYQQKHDGQSRPGRASFGGTGVGNPGTSVRDPGVNARQDNQTDRIRKVSTPMS